MSKIIKVMIDDEIFEIKARRIKNKQFKNLVKKIAEKADELVKFFDNKDIVSNLPIFIQDNLDFILEDLIAPFIDVKNSEKDAFLDELSTYDTILLLKDLLNYNGIPTEKIIEFITKNFKVQNSESTIGKKLEDKQNKSGTEIPLLP